LGGSSKKNSDHLTIQLYSRKILAFPRFFFGEECGCHSVWFDINCLGSSLSGNVKRICRPFFSIFEEKKRLMSVEQVKLFNLPRAGKKRQTQRHPQFIAQA
jgi:hypothetical protein